MEKKGENPANFSLEATKMERNMSRDALRKMATKPGSGSTRSSPNSKEIIYKWRQNRHNGEVNIYSGRLNSFLDRTCNTTAIIPSPKGTAQIEPISDNIQALRLSENTPPTIARIPGTARTKSINQIRA
jgi:hypothetical protein